MYRNQSLGGVIAPAPIPPLSTLPQWSRVKTQIPGYYPNTYVKDRYVPIINMEKIENVDTSDHDAMNSNLIESNALTLQQKKFDKAMSFMQTKHHEMLSNLHTEVDRLKRINKELQFQLVLLNKSSSSLSASSISNSHRLKPLENVPSSYDNSSLLYKSQPNSEHNTGRNSNKAELKIIVLEKELEKLKSILKEEKKKNEYLTKMVEKLKNREERNLNDAQQLLYKDEENDLKTQTRFEKNSFTYQLELPFKITIDPLQIKDKENQMSRIPTIKECEMIIKNLILSKESQASELNELKSHINMMLQSKTDVESCLSTDVIVLDEKENEICATEKLPFIHFKHHPKSELISYPAKQEMIMLPALKQTMGLKAVDRVKKSQQIQKTRQRREIIN